MNSLDEKNSSDLKCKKKYEIKKWNKTMNNFVDKNSESKKAPSELDSFL